MAQTFRERADAPDGTTDEREIWMMIRSWITLIRVVLVIAIIVIAEIFEEHSLFNLSLSVWAIVLGFPLFLLLSMIIIQGDKRFAPDLEENRRKKIEKSSRL
jgi:magnesium-transporting ATPase (P-type)